MNNPPPFFGYEILLWYIVNILFYMYKGIKECSQANNLQCYFIAYTPVPISLPLSESLVGTQSE